MSDSELSVASHTPVPPDTDLERSLREELLKASKSGEDYSYKSIRTASEIGLGLKAGFFKSHGQWNKKSKVIIDDEMQHLDDDQASPQKPKKSPKQPPSKTKSTEPPSQSRKRPTPEKDSGPRKMQKPADVDVTNKEVRTSSKGHPRNGNKMGDPNVSKTTSKTDKASTQHKASKKASKKETSSEDEDAKEMVSKQSDSESELSEVLDDEPRPKKSRKTKGETSKPKSRGDKASKTKADNDEDPDLTEIKRLQGWLVKCGIRKVWGKELKPYETSKAKIKHLKDMLSDVGLTGRYSLEKADQIREARELAADIEAVKEGAERWGTGEDVDIDADDGVDQSGNRSSSRRLVRGSKNYDFLSSDGEETD